MRRSEEKYCWEYSITASSDARGARRGNTT